jgi:hypothetical protein
MLPIYISIKKAAELGMTHTFWQSNLTDLEKRELEQNGYRLRDCYDKIRNENCFEIRW